MSASYNSARTPRSPPCPPKRRKPSRTQARNRPVKNTEPPRGKGRAMSEMSASAAAHGHDHAGDHAHGVLTIDVDARGWEPVIERFRKPALIAAGAGWLLLLLGIFVSGW